MDHRWGNRIEVNLPVSVGSAKVAGAGVLRNLSASGAFLETQLPLGLLTMVRVRVSRHGQAGHGIDVRGFVVREDETGVGLEWCDALECLEDLTRPLVQLPSHQPVVDLAHAS